MHNSFFTKKEFISFIEKQIKENEIVVLTDVNTSFNFRKMKGYSVEFAYHPAGFKVPDDVSVIMKAKNVALNITTKENLSVEVLDGLKEHNQITFKFE